MKNWLSRFFLGRYCLYCNGFDKLTVFLLMAIVAMGLLSVVLSLILPIGFLLDLFLWVLRTAEMAAFVWMIFRLLSRNIHARRMENAAYLKLKASFMNKFKRSSSKTHKVFPCPNCHAKIRVPRGKGKIRIHCPKCNAAFIKRT